MPRRYWLAKSEPAKYSWQDFESDGSTYWNGVRNAQARNHLAEMKRRDLVLFYHSQEGKEVVGIARVVRPAYPDPTTRDNRWVAVDLEPVRPLARPVPLREIKKQRDLAGIPLVRQARLSVMPLEKGAFDRIVAMGGGAGKKATGKKKAGTKKAGTKKTGTKKTGKKSKKKKKTRKAAG